MKNNGKMLLVITLIVVLAAAAIGGGFGLTTMRNRRIYTEKIESGDKYLAMGDYDNAVLMYQDAIRTNDKEETGYLKLANAHAEQSYYALAIGVLENGFAKTKSSRIQEMLLVYKEMANAGGQAQGKEPLLNKTMLSKITGSSYGDYVKRNEVESVQTGASGEAIVRIAGIPATFIYLPAVYTGGQVSESAFPSEVRFDNLISLLGVNGTVTKAQLQTMEFDDVEIIDGLGTGYQLHLIYLGSSFYVPCDQDGTISTTAAGVMEPQVTATAGQQEADDEDGTLMQGYVEDAQSGSPLSGVKMKVYAGNSTVDEPVAEYETDESGYYSLRLESGQYTVVLSKEGYVDTTKEIYLGSYAAEQEETFVLSAESTGEIRLVLEWNSGECDLDSYLISSGDVMKFSNREIYSGGQLAASLDRDSRSGPGVETTTIYDMNGSYEFYVFDYMLSGGMQSSGATVTIYVPGESPRTVSIPQDAGNTWHVCEISGGKVTVTNFMAEEGYSAAPK